MGEFTIKYFGSIEIDSDHVPNANEYQNAIGGLIFEANEEFVPPLTYRKGSAGHSSVSNQKNLRLWGLNDYTATMLTQKNIVAYDSKEEIVAFMSFRHDYEKRDYLLHPKVGLVKDDKVNYVTTLIVGENGRRKGIASLLYNYIEDKLPESVHANVIATRTWHSSNDSNIAHISLLIKREYNLTCTLHEEREFNGKRYDTVYYAKRVDRKQKFPRRSD